MKRSVVEAERKLLIIEDSSALASAIASALSHVAMAAIASTIAAARIFLEVSNPDCIIMDVCLPDGVSLELLPVIRTLRPLPRVIAISGAAEPEQAFNLAQAGVRAFINKPLDLRRLEETWARIMTEPPDLEPFVRACVGQRSLSSLETLVRKEMTEEAFARSNGNVSRAARLLEVSRQLYQYIRRSSP